MADRTFNDLVTEALHDDFDSTKYTTLAGQALNDALRLIARSVDLPALNGTSTITTAAGTNSYSPPSDLVRVKSITDATTHATLTELKDIGQFDAFLASSGNPTAYLLYGGSLLLYPTPKAVRTYTLRYRKDAAVISGTTTITAVMPDDYAHMLVEYIRARLFRLEDDPQLADYWEAKFKESLGLLKADVQRQTPRGNRQIGANRYATTFPSFQRP